VSRGVASLASAGHERRARVVLEGQVVPDAQAAPAAEALLEISEELGVAQLPAAALAREADPGEERHDRHRVRRLPRLWVVAERVEGGGPLGRVEHHVVHAGVEPRGERHQLSLDVAGQQVVLALHVGGLVEVAPLDDVRLQRILPEQLCGPALRRQPDRVRQEQALLRLCVAGAVRERLHRRGLDVRDAPQVPVDRGLAATRRVLGPGTTHPYGRHHDQCECRCPRPLQVVS
jgi:hypothetical protein